MPWTKAREIIRDSGSPQCSLLLHCKLAHFGMFLHQNICAVETTFGSSSEYMLDHKGIFYLLSVESLQLVPCAVMCSLLPLLPESPRWLVMKDRRDDAHEALRRYLGKDLPLDEPVVVNELLSIEEAYNIERQSRISLKEVILCRDRSGHLKRLLLGCGGQFMQQFGGINALNYYFPIILTENIGLSEFMARVLTGCNATSYMISSALCFWMIERFGRRSLMLSGLVLQCWAYVMVAISVALLTHAPFQVINPSRAL